jgi:hypothetical protein
MQQNAIIILPSLKTNFVIHRTFFDFFISHNLDYNVIYKETTEFKWLLCNPWLKHKKVSRNYNIDQVLHRLQSNT